MGTATDRFSGDPRIVLTVDGAEFDYRGGQPVMDQGFENNTIMSLLTRKGWAGNIFLPVDEQIGSTYIEETEQPITMTQLRKIESAAIAALDSDIYGSVDAETTEPETNHISTEIKIGSGGSLSVTRNKALWTMQVNNPANSRLKKEYQQT